MGGSTIIINDVENQWCGRCTGASPSGWAGGQTPEGTGDPEVRDAEPSTGHGDRGRAQVLFLDGEEASPKVIKEHLQ